MTRMGDEKQNRPRVLVVTSAAYHPPFVEEVGELHRQGTAPRVWLLDLDAELTFLDQRLLTDPPRGLRWFYAAMPIWMAQAFEAYRTRRRFDVIFCWGAETVALPLALMLKLTGARASLVALFNWISPPKKARLLRLAQSAFTRLILPSSRQRQIAIERLGIPAAKVVDIPWCIDEEFWQPRGPVEQVTISSAGREMRDYETLVKALEGLDIPCHIAGAVVRGKSDQWRTMLGDSGEDVALPDNVTIGPLSAVELRDLYARSRFVVLALHPSDTDNGTTCVLEAWSMGRPVICSQTDGQRDVLEHGRQGLYVPPGDVDALRKAILELWYDTARAHAMGSAGRRAIEENYRSTRFSREVTDVLRQAASVRRGNG
jgi:glycosyltransferase involved in cell wall biosynthesis